MHTVYAYIYIYNIKSIVLMDADALDAADSADVSPR